MWVTATAHRSAKAAATSASSSENTCGRSSSSRKITPTTSPAKIIGTAMIERIFQKRTVDLTVRGSVRAFWMITGRCVSSSSRVMPSAGTPASERLMLRSRLAPPLRPTQPRNTSPASSRRWMLQRSTPISALISRATTCSRSSTSVEPAVAAATRENAATARGRRGAVLTSDRAGVDLLEPDLPVQRHAHVPTLLMRSSSAVALA